MPDLALGMESDAVLDVSGVYRFRLTRRWDRSRPTTVWVLLNPSKADAVVPDPTLDRCIAFARKWGFGGVELLNLFPFRATEPKGLVTAHRRGVDVACRAQRDAYIASTLLEAGVAPIAGWGAHPMAGPEQHTVLKLARRWMALRLTKSGAPGHPLYLPGYLEPVEWAYPGMVKR